MYQHLVQYYETDKMGITHHSNYIRFMEEARLDFFKKIGFDYLEFEKMGIISPVIGLNNIKFRKSSTVGNVLNIDVSVKSYNSIVLTLHYIMKINETTIFEGDSEHCFLNKDGKVMPLNDQTFPELDCRLKEMANKL